MKIIIFIFCLIFITIGYTSAADDQIPVEVIETTDSPLVENVSELTEIKEDEKLIEKTTSEKPKIDITKKSRVLTAQSRRLKNDEKKINVITTTTRTTTTTTEKSVEKPIEKLETKSRPSLVIDRGSDKFTENVIHSNSNGPDDYSFSFKTEEGHNRDELVHIDRTGKSLNDNDDDLGQVSAKGSYSFISADGFEYTVDYIADGKGYHPKVNVRKI